MCVNEYQQSVAGLRFKPVRVARIGPNRSRSCNVVGISKRGAERPDEVGDLLPSGWCWTRKLTPSAWAQALQGHEADALWRVSGIAVRCPDYSSVNPTNNWRSPAGAGAAVIGHKTGEAQSQRRC